MLYSATFTGTQVVTGTMRRHTDEVWCHARCCAFNWDLRVTDWRTVVLWPDAELYLQAPASTVRVHVWYSQDGPYSPLHFINFHSRLVIIVSNCQNTTTGVSMELISENTAASKLSKVCQEINQTSFITLVRKDSTSRSKASPVAPLDRASTTSFWSAMKTDDGYMTVLFNLRIVLHSFI